MKLDGVQFHKYFFIRQIPTRNGSNIPINSIFKINLEIGFDCSNPSDFLKLFDFQQNDSDKYDFHGEHEPSIELQHRIHLCSLSSYRFYCIGCAINRKGNNGKGEPHERGGWIELKFYDITSQLIGTIFTDSNPYDKMFVINVHIRHNEHLTDANQQFGTLISQIQDLDQWIVANSNVIEMNPGNAVENRMKMSYIDDNWRDYEDWLAVDGKYKTSCVDKIIECCDCFKKVVIGAKLQKKNKNIIRCYRCFEKNNK